MRFTCKRFFAAAVMALAGLLWADAALAQGAPTIAAVTTTCGSVLVTFSKPVDKATATDIEFRLYEVSKGTNPVLTKTYKRAGANTRQLVHRWANEVVKYYMARRASSV